MNNISPVLRRCLFLLPLTLTITSHGIAQRFEPRIVFASNHDGNSDIYSVDVHGNNLVQLTDHPAPDNHPSGSPDGRRITFTSRRGLTPDLYVMDSNGNNVIRLTRDNFDERRPSWTPDGTRIAFSSFRWVVGNWEIYAMDANGANRTRLTEHKMQDVDPSWSPDGRKIAFVSAPKFGAQDPRHIFVMNADGKGRRNLTGDTNLTHNWAPTWSPDGRKIAFNSLRHFVPADSRNDIFVITADGIELEQLTDGPGTSTSAVYSPDGTKIAFVSGRRGNSNIYIMDATGKNAVNLTRTPPGIDNRSPSWPHGGLAVTRNGKLPISWGVLKRTGNP